MSQKFINARNVEKVIAEPNVMDLKENNQGKSLLIQIPEKTIIEQFGWLSEKGNTREGVVRAFILKHPERIESNLTIENLVAINVWLNKWREEDENYFEYAREADLIFEKDGIYYLVETKREKKIL